MTPEAEELIARLTPCHCRTCPRMGRDSCKGAEQFDIAMEQEIKRLNRLVEEYDKRLKEIEAQFADLAACAPKVSGVKKSCSVCTHHSPCDSWCSGYMHFSVQDDARNCDSFELRT